MSGIAAAIAIGGAGALAAGIGAAVGGPDAPETPDYAAASRAGILADIETLGQRRRIEAAAKLGQELLKPGYTRIGSEEATQAMREATDRLAAFQAQEQPLIQKISDLQASPYWTPAHQSQFDYARKELTDLRAKIQSTQTGLIELQSSSGVSYKDASGNVVPRSEAVDADFTGYGEADVQGDFARQMAEANLGIQKDLGPEYVANARKLLEQADPEGWAKRQELAQLVSEITGRAPDTEMARQLQGQLRDELNLGGTLDPETRREVDQYVLGQQVREGGGFGTSDIFTRGQEIGSAAEARRGQRQQKALSFLTSGKTPDDILTADEMKKAGVLTSFTRGESPTGQFQQLSGTQQQSVPFMTTTPGPTLNPNAGQSGANFAQQNYGQQMNWASQQANPWLAGLGTAFNAIGTGINAYTALRPQTPAAATPSTTFI